jgi:hypothetical protein
MRDEVERRRNASAVRRAHDAGLVDDMVFERWDKTARVTYDRRVLQELVSLRFVGRAASPMRLAMTCRSLTNPPS